DPNGMLKPHCGPALVPADCELPLAFREDHPRREASSCHDDLVALSDRDCPHYVDRWNRSSVSHRIVEVEGVLVAIVAGVERKLQVGALSGLVDLLIDFRLASSFCCDVCGELGLSVRRLGQFVCETCVDCG